MLFKTLLLVLPFVGVQSTAIPEPDDKKIHHHGHHGHHHIGHGHKDHWSYGDIECFRHFPHDIHFDYDKFGKCCKGLPYRGYFPPREGCPLFQKFVPVGRTVLPELMRNIRSLPCHKKKHSICKPIICIKKVIKYKTKYVKKYHKKHHNKDYYPKDYYPKHGHGWGHKWNNDYKYNNKWGGKWGGDYPYDKKNDYNKWGGDYPYDKKNDYNKY